MRKVGLGTALIVILFLSAALAGIQYAGYRLLGLPYTPADLYDWLVRSGWDAWTGLVNGLSGFFAGRGQSTTAAAATAEALLSLALYFLLAFLAGLVFYLLAGRRRVPPEGIDGVTIGAAWGVPMLLVSLFAGRSLADPLTVIVWLLGLYLLWGVALSYAFRRLMQPVAPPPITTADDPATMIDPEMAARLDRRRFLFQLGASTAAITAIGATAGTLLGSDEQHALRPFPIADPEFLAAQSALLDNFRRFAIVGYSTGRPEEAAVLTLGAEFPDRNYVSVWLGEGSPIVVYESLESVLAAYSNDTTETTVLWLDGPSI